MYIYKFNLRTLQFYISKSTYKHYASYLVFNIEYPRMFICYRDSKM